MWPGIGVGPRPLPRVGGFTLTEVLMTMTVGLIVLGMAAHSFIVQWQAYSAQRQVTEMVQNARTSVDLLAMQLRMVSAISALDSTPCTSSITYLSVQAPTQPRGLSRSSSGNTLQYTQGGQTQPRTGNITCLTIVQQGSVFTITLSARTSAKDPGLHDYRSLTLSTTVRARCLQVPPSTVCS